MKSIEFGSDISSTLNNFKNVPYFDELWWMCFVLCRAAIWKAILTKYQASYKLMTMGYNIFPSNKILIECYVNFRCVRWLPTVLATAWLLIRSQSDQQRLLWTRTVRNERENALLYSLIYLRECNRKEQSMPVLVATVTRQLRIDWELGMSRLIGTADKSADIWRFQNNR
jgi:hypothetical protein